MNATECCLTRTGPVAGVVCKLFSIFLSLLDQTSTDQIDRP